MSSIDAVFPSIEAALLFAYRHAHGDIARPLMNRMADGPSRVGNGMVGIDGAAQAGLIRAAVASLGDFAEAMTVARYAERSHPCRTCSTGRQFDEIWAKAVELVTEHALVAVPARLSQRRLREAVVMRYFGEKVSLTAIAASCRVDKDTASAHANAISTLLKSEEGKLRAALAELLQRGELVEV